MAYHFVISSGLPDFLPNSQQVFQAYSIPEANAIIEEEISRWCEDGLGHRAIDFHGIGGNYPDASQWSWILAFANQGGEELTLQGLTEQEASEWEEQES